MKHRGEIVKEAMKERGIAMGFVADSLNIHRSTLFYKLKAPNLNFDLIIRIYQTIGRDVQKDFPEMLNNEGKVEEEPLVDRKEIEMWKMKTVVLMEEKIKLQDQLIETLKREVDLLRSKLK